MRKILSRPLVKNLLWIVPLVVVLMAISIPLGTYRTYQLSRAMVLIIAVLGLNILTGYNGQISLGHGALLGIGAYVTGILMTKGLLGTEIHPLLTVPLSGLAAAVVGIAIGIPALRLRGPYLAIATLALALALPPVLKLRQLEDITGGVQNILVPRTDRPVPPPPLDQIFFQDEWIFVVTLLCAAALTLLACTVLNSRVGRAWVAIRDSDVAAQQMGINVSLYKVMAFAVSAFYAGIAGGLYVLVVGFLSPESFGLVFSIDFLAAMVIGGLASVLGAILGGLFLVFQYDVVDYLADRFEGADELRWAIYGSIVILIMIFMPRGVAGFIHSAVRWARARVPLPSAGPPAPVAAGPEGTPREAEAGAAEPADGPRRLGG